MTCYPDLYENIDGIIVRPMPLDPGEYASLMFATIRDLDNLGMDEIVATEVPEEGIGTAIMDRLRRAAFGR